MLCGMHGGRVEFRPQRGGSIRLCAQELQLGMDWPHAEHTCIPPQLLPNLQYMHAIIDDAEYVI
jgi:hypothetical protein